MWRALGVEVRLVVNPAKAREKWHEGCDGCKRRPRAAPLGGVTCGQRRFWNWKKKLGLPEDLRNSGPRRGSTTGYGTSTYPRPRLEFVRVASYRRRTRRDGQSLACRSCFANASLWHRAAHSVGEIARFLNGHRRTVNSAELGCSWPWGDTETDSVDT